MEIRRELSPHDPSSPGTALTIGAYDGVHVGHRQVVAEVRRLANERGLASAVVTFDRHPATVVRPESAPLLLTDNEQKLEQLVTTGVDLTLVVPFDDATRAHPRFNRVMGQLTVATGCWQFLTSAWDVWLFNRTGSAGDYVLIRFLVGWPAGTLATLVAFAWADRALRPVPGFPGILDLLVPPDDGDEPGGPAG